MDDRKEYATYIRVNAAGKPIQFLETDDPSADCVRASPEMVEELLDNPQLLEDYTLQEDGTFKKEDAFASQPWHIQRKPTPLYRIGNAEEAQVVLSANNLVWLGSSGKIHITLVDTTNLPIRTFQLEPNSPIPIEMRQPVNAYWFPVSGETEEATKNNWPAEEPVFFHQEDFT